MCNILIRPSTKIIGYNDHSLAKKCSFKHRQIRHHEYIGDGVISLVSSVLSAKTGINSIITRIWNWVMNFGTGSRSAIPATSH